MHIRTIDFSNGLLVVNLYPNNKEQYVKTLIILVLQRLKNKVNKNIEKILLYSYVLITRHSMKLS